jgi:cytochrome c5
MKKHVIALLLFGSIAGLLYLNGCSKPTTCGKGAGSVLDEAKCAGREPQTFASSEDNYLADMDYGITHNPAEVAARLSPFIPGITPSEAVKAAIRGRNTWVLWSGGNDRLWDKLSRISAGNMDLLKTLSDHPSIQYSRDNRWQYMGLVNEPCFKRGTIPRSDRYGLWLDVRDTNCGPEPFEDETKYPGVKIGARGKNIPVGSYYGYATGVVGLRLFPNPDFDEKAQKRWDPERYYTDPNYYLDKNLVKPYRVGMTCGFCHVGPNPTNPPHDPEHPAWANLNSNPGAQYFRIDRVFNWNPMPDNFATQLFHTARPGALDTSLVPADNINNPGAMNAMYNLAARLEIAKKFGKESLASGSKNNRQLNDFVSADSPLAQFYKAPDTVFTPHVLKDGADSVGALGALNRVYINIGTFSEESLEHFRPLVGGKDVSPIEITVARAHSSYWNATEHMTPDVALFFLASARPDYLRNAPGGEKYLTADNSILNRGKTVFAERCASCHSSKLPPKAFEFFTDKSGKVCDGAKYLDCWKNYWEWTKTDEFKELMTPLVTAPDFLDNNFLSSDLRVPVTILETNACRPLATNALKDKIWDNFSSQSYKDLPSVGTIIVHNPYTGAPSQYTMPAGGRGYSRPPSLVSIWSTAPFLLNNSLGAFRWSGSVDDRMASFNDSIEKLLWPEKRDGNLEIVTDSGKKLLAQVDVTTTRSYLIINSGFLPDFLQVLVDPLHRWLPWLVGDKGIRIGPIRGGMPVNMLANIDMDKKDQVAWLLLKIAKDLSALPQDASDEDARKAFADLVPPLLDVSKCPDFVVNRGHYFGTDYSLKRVGLGDEDKRALIEFMKTF